MKTSLLSLLASSLLLVVAPAFAKSPGQFITAGPTNADGDVISIQWRFGFHFTISPDAISEVSFSCAPIPGSTVIVKAADLKIDAQGNGFAVTAATPMSQAATPWLYEKDTTSAICEALVTTTQGEQLSEKAPLRFAAQTKFAIVLQMEEAFKYNSQLKAKGK